MSFDYKTLDMEAMTVAPLKLKELDENEYLILNSLRKEIIDIWDKHDEKFLVVNGRRYELVPVNNTK